MAAIVAKRVRTTQPQQNPQIDWGNPITVGLEFAYVCLNDAIGFGQDGRNLIKYALNSNQSSILGNQVATPTGMGVQSNSGAGYIFTAGNRTISTGAYSMFVAATGTASGFQSAIDDDDGSTRRFQFRTNAGKASFIPFSSSTNTEVLAPVALTATELANGFTMGATVNSTTATVYQNKVKTSAAFSGALAPQSTVNIGAKKDNSRWWAVGAIQLAAMWNRTLTDAEMASLADNPWQLFKPAPRRLWLAYSAPAGTTGSLASTLGGLTLAASGAVVDQGAFASSLAGATLAGSGQVATPPSGSLTSTLVGAAVTASGNVTNTGALGSTLDGASMSASGIVLNRGALTSTLDGAGMAASGQIVTIPAGTMASTLDGAGMAAGGYVGTPPAVPQFFIRLPKNPRHVLPH